MLLKVEQVGERATPFVLSIRVNSIEREKKYKKKLLQCNYCKGN